MIALKIREWNKISRIIKEENSHKPSIFLIRETMKRELGFTTRYHKQWDPGMNNFTETVFLDFYDDTVETFFRLKYITNDIVA